MGGMARDYVLRLVVATVEMRLASTNAWQFEAPIPLPTPSSTHRHPFLHPMQHSVFPLMGMAMLGALSVAAWLWQGRAQHVAALRNDSPSTSSADMRRMPAVMME